MKGYPGDCACLHGHNWGVTVVVAVENIDELGMGIDFRILHDSLDKLIREFDHKHLNSLEVFQEKNPTAESIARYIFQKMKSELPEGTSVVEVKVQETDTDWASYME
jgi:6-pyruvoyltetrahydropterin/6-carboxytetrahydropterin synthase